MLIPVPHGTFRSSEMPEKRNSAQRLSKFIKLGKSKRKIPLPLSLPTREERVGFLVFLGVIVCFACLQVALRFTCGQADSG
jgi:hypothetical protein